MPLHYLKSRSLRFTSVSREALALSLIALAFSWVCFRNIRQPGLYGDEAWGAVFPARFVWRDAVIDPAPYHEVRLFGRTFPYMANDYTGPVKTYILAASFSLFGVSVSVLRVTMSLVGLAGVLGLYLLVKHEFGRLAAVVSGLLLATDLSFILAVRGDWSVVAFALLARVLALYFLLAWRRAPKRPWLLFLGTMMMGLGLSHKFDFLSFLAAAVIGYFLLYAYELRPRLRDLATGLVGFLAGAWPILLYNLLTHGGTLQAGRAISDVTGKSLFPQTIAQLWPFLQASWKTLGDRWLDLQSLLGGVALANWMLAERIDHASLLGNAPLPLAVKLSVLPLLAFAIRHRYRQSFRTLCLISAISVLTLLFVAMTPIAAGPHHVMSVYPFPHLFVGVALAGIWQGWDRTPKWLVWIGRSVAAAAATLLLASNLSLAQAYHQHLAIWGGNSYWSEAIYDLSYSLQGPYSGRTVVLMDWGFEQPLTITGGGKFKLEAPYWRIMAEENPGPWLSSLIRRPDCLFVLRAEKFAFDRRIHERFRAAYLKEAGLNLEEQKFFQKNGEHAFSILQFR
jgi:hypothetical protein